MTDVTEAARVLVAARRYWLESRLKHLHEIGAPVNKGFAYQVEQGKWDKDPELQGILSAIAAERERGIKDGFNMAIKALCDDAKMYDCSARSEGECTCGAWCEWKTRAS